MKLAMIVASRFSVETRFVNVSTRLIPRIKTANVYISPTLSEEVDKVLSLIIFSIDLARISVFLVRLF